MKYYINGKEFNTYREAELYCGERGIHPEEIEEEEAE
jgi:hypothetical protein